MRAVIYARYSSDMQRAASIEDQVRLCQRLIAQNDWTETRTYSDKGMSGATHLRPGYQQLLHDARNGGFDVVVSEGLDRISRDQEHIAAFFKQMAFQGIPILTVSEGRISELHIGLKGTMSSLFLKDLAQKTHRGLEGRVHKGLSAGGISYGYDVLRQFRDDGSVTTGERSINAAEAAVVIRIFTAFADGLSPRAIAGMLNKEGIRGPRATWGSSTIHGNWRRGTGILNNELYIGKLIWNRQRFVKDPMTGKRQALMNQASAWIAEEVPDLRIIDQALWDRVKARQGVSRYQMSTTGGTRPERARRPKYLLSGLIQCGCCGGGYTLVGKIMYGCANARNKGTCDNRLTIRRDMLEEAVLTGLRSKLLHPDLIEDFMAEYHKEFNLLASERSKDRRAQERELAGISGQIDQIVNAIADGMYHPSMKAKMTDLEARKAELSSLLGSDEEQPLRVHPGLAAVYARKVADLTASLNVDGTRVAAVELLRGLINSIRLVPEGGQLKIELVGELANILLLGDVGSEKPRRGAHGADAVTMVAGTGFEPVTFRL